VGRFALRQAVLGAPANAALRLDYAQALLAAGHRAAAWHEVLAVRRLGARIPKGLLGLFRLENPVGVVWTFVPLPVAPGEVAPVDVRDPWYPGAAATSVTRTLPLVLLLGRYCTDCDENGVAVCTDCGGTGWKRSLLGDGEEPCPERDTCNRCAGSKYLVNVYRAARGECPHPHVVPEAEGATWTLERCTVCGLASVSSFPLWTGLWACAECGLFDCLCSPG
jgi:hypothetical protein